MNQEIYDLIYYTPEDAEQAQMYSADPTATIPSAFECVVTLLSELDELEEELADIPESVGGYDAGEEGPDDQHRLDTVSLIEMRYEDIEQLVKIFQAHMPATLDARVALNAMEIALTEPDPSGEPLDGEDLVRRWLSSRRDECSDPVFRSFYQDITYLVDLPTERRKRLTA